MLKRLGWVIVAGAAVSAAGCLRKETTHTLYISPDHQVTWVAVEGDVRSDDTDPMGRFGEERDYVAAVAEGRHPIAKALSSIAPESIVRTQLLRDERPFRVQTDVRAGSIDHALQRLFDAAGLHTVVRLTQEAARVDLAVRFDFSVPIAEANHPAAVLMEDIQAFKLVLTEGRFVAADGWDTSGDVALLSKAWLDRVEEAMRDGRGLSLTLSWETR